LSSPAQLVACETCGGNDRDAEGRPRGARLLSFLQALTEPSVANVEDTEQLPQEGPRDPTVSVTSVRCLWACKRSCAVHVRSADRVGYVLADLEPTQETAQALLTFAGMYEQSADGAVPFRQWPPLLKGHFLCRIPAPIVRSHAELQEDREV
jgi:predicted metal-binding protein